jgi:hypothetical protein
MFTFLSVLLKFVHLAKFSMKSIHELYSNYQWILMFLQLYAQIYQHFGGDIIFKLASNSFASRNGVYIRSNIKLKIGSALVLQLCPASQASVVTAALKFYNIMPPMK